MAAAASDGDRVKMKSSASRFKGVGGDLELLTTRSDDAKIALSETF